LGLLVAHHQEITMYICMWQLVRVVRLISLPAAWFQSDQARQQWTKMYNMYQLLHLWLVELLHIYSAFWKSLCT
jgi:hypothetical protein